MAERSQETLTRNTAAPNQGISAELFHGFVNKTLKALKSVKSDMFGCGCI